MNQGAGAPPDRLRILVDEDRRRPLRQPAVPFEHRRWIARVPDHADTLGDLPNPLTRENVRSFVADRAGDRWGVVAGFIATQVWGYGAAGYGAFRLAKALAHPALTETLLATRECLLLKRPLDAFRVLCVEQPVPALGTSFGSKYLYFADPHGRALILDGVVAGWVKEHAGVKLGLYRDVRSYARWLDLAHLWADSLQVDPDRLEMIIFSDALEEGSSWKPARGESPAWPARAVGRPSSASRLTCAEAIAVVLLDAGRPLRAAEIADEINRRHLYRRADGKPLPAYHVRSIAYANRRRFRIHAGLIELPNTVAE